MIKMRNKPILYINTDIPYNGKPKINDIDDLSDSQADEIENSIITFIKNNKSNKKIIKDFVDELSEYYNLGICVVRDITLYVKSKFK